MEKKLAQDGRRAEAEILIQEMLDRFRSDLEKEYAERIKGIYYQGTKIYEYAYS